MYATARKFWILTGKILPFFNQKLPFFVKLQVMKFTTRSQMSTQPQKIKNLRYQGHFPTLSTTPRVFFQILFKIQNILFALNSPLPITILTFIKIDFTAENRNKQINNLFMFLRNLNSNKRKPTVYCKSNSSILIKKSPKPTIIYS